MQMIDLELTTKSLWLFWINYYNTTVWKCIGSQNQCLRICRGSLFKGVIWRRELLAMSGRGPWTIDPSRPRSKDKVKIVKEKQIRGKSKWRMPWARKRHLNKWSIIDLSDFLPKRTKISLQSKLSIYSRTISCLRTNSTRILVRRKSKPVSCSNWYRQRMPMI